MVRIQTQLTRDANVDRLSDEVEVLAQEKPNRLRAEGRSRAETDCAVATCEMEPPAVRAADVDDPDEVPDHEIRWLEPERDQIGEGPHGTLRLQIGDRDPVDGVFVVCSFPASSMEQYLSLRSWDAEGDDTELGMIRDLTAWPKSQQQIVREQLQRRYLFRPILAIDSLELKHGHLWFQVQTDVGPQSFGMRWRQSQAIDFGAEGKMLFDVEDNRYLIADVDALPPRDRDLFRRFVYW